jgi:hypothetical protein
MLATEWTAYRAGCVIDDHRPGDSPAVHPSTRFYEGIFDA